MGAAKKKKKTPTQDKAPSQYDPTIAPAPLTPKPNETPEQHLQREYQEDPRFHSPRSLADLTNTRKPE